MIVLRISAEEASQISRDLLDMINWLEGFEAGRGIPFPLPISMESLRQFGEKIRNQEHLELIQHEKF